MFLLRNDVRQSVDVGWKWTIDGKQFILVSSVTPIRKKSSFKWFEYSVLNGKPILDWDVVIRRYIENIMNLQYVVNYFEMFSCNKGNTIFTSVNNFLWFNLIKTWISRFGPFRYFTCSGSQRFRCHIFEVIFLDNHGGHVVNVESWPWDKLKSKRSLKHKILF